MHKKRTGQKKTNSLRQQAEQLLSSRIGGKRKFLITDIEKLIDELDVHEAELQIQNEELQNTLLHLEISQKKYFESYENAPVGYLNLDENSQIVGANLTLCNLLGISRTELINKRFTDFISKEGQDTFFLQTQNTLKTKHKQTYELKLIRKGDLQFYAYIESMVAKNNFNHRNGLYLSVIDVTIRKLAEEELRHHLFELNQASRISSLETLSSALAHEINQPVAAINNFINGCIRRLEGKAYRKNELLAALKEARQQTERVGRIVHHLKDFLRKGHLHNERIDINEVIKEVAHLVNQEPLPIKVEIFIQLLNPPIFLLANKLQIELVLLNLIRNSIEAMADAHTHKPELTIQAVKINSHIQISVSDNGPGLNEEAFKKLFSPFFTTKQHGLGIGLAICHAIISGHGGELSAKKSDQGGACFEFKLPLP